jgi:hypothetical protein
MSAPATADLWWKNAVIYCLDVQTFADSSGDGMGDFGGLTAHVDDLAGLGVTCIWLMPFYPTVDRDDGYDVTDYYAIDPRLGTFGDFTEFMAVARDRGMRVIADLVVNHTSDQHHWFQEARRSRESKFRDFYVWQDEIPEDGPDGVVFEGEQTGVWTFDHEAGQYYLHRFYHHQPDLNVANEEVRNEIAKVMGLLARPGPLRLPRRRRALPDRARRDRRGDGDRTSHVSAEPACLPPAEARRRDHARRGQPAVRAAARVLRRRGRRRAPHAVRLHRDAGDLPGDGPRATPAR